jgi:hypothetical protein
MGYREQRQRTTHARTGTEMEDCGDGSDYVRRATTQAMLLDLEDSFR